jgi:hypothetical protein
MKRVVLIGAIQIAAALCCTALVACESTGSQLVGKWDGTGPDSFHCVLDISKNGDSVAIKTENFTPGGSGRCDQYAGLFKITKEGNLERGAEGVVLSFDKSKSQLSSYRGEWYYFTKTQ